MSAINAASRRPAGLMLLIMAIAVSMNYHANPTHNWLTALVAAIEKNAVWKWLGEYIKTRYVQVVHSLWIASAAFLGAPQHTALLVTVFMTVLTMMMNPTTTYDVFLQCTFVFFILAVRQQTYRLLLVIALIATIIAGHAFLRYSF